MSPAGDKARWAAVLARDTSNDGVFYFAVGTTGVYCKPSCPARRAKRENVSFFETCGEAEAAGFRACKRCKPRAASEESKSAMRIIAACRMIDAADPPPALSELAACAGLSPFHFHRVFKAVTGVTPKAYATAHRNSRVRAALQTSATVTDAIYDAGFSSTGRFYKEADAVLGMSPSAYKSGGTNAVLKFAIGTCSLGTILVAATGKGVAAILLGDSADRLLKDLQDRFPKAELTGGDAEFDGLVGRAIAAVEDPRLAAALPLDVRGTVFQHKVWSALRAIPAGATVSYTEVANRIGMPKAARAVAGACAANPLAVVIPCHRVVRTDGDVSGYRWGIARKRQLLDREAKTAQTQSQARPKMITPGRQHRG